MDSFTDISSVTLTATVTTTANQINVLLDTDSVKLCEHCHKYYDTIKMAWTNDKLLCHNCQPNNL